MKQYLTKVELYITVEASCKEEAIVRTVEILNNHMEFDNKVVVEVNETENFLNQ